jgi:transposase
MENRMIAETLGAQWGTIGKWPRRFAERLVHGLYDEPRGGALQRIDDHEVAETIRLTLATTPPVVTHWSLRSLGTPWNQDMIDDAGSGPYPYI